MSSFVENCAWYADFDLEVFDWHEWIQTLPLPMPIYDVTRIVDSAAAYDMAMHARHWAGTHIGGLRIPDVLRRHMRCVGLKSLAQQQYMARALYSHCARYVTGMPRIRPPPTDHIKQTEVVPREVFQALMSALHAEDKLARRTLQCWLTNVLVYGSKRSTTLNVRYGVAAANSGRRRYRQSVSDVLDVDKMQAAANATLASISRYHHTLPQLRCIISLSGPGKVSIGLYAHLRAPCGE